MAISPSMFPSFCARRIRALYHAKERGRNRVELASLDLVLPRKEGAANVRLAAKTAA
jgi:hypothetical protein